MSPVLLPNMDTRHIYNLVEPPGTYGAEQGCSQPQQCPDIRDARARKLPSEPNQHGIVPFCTFRKPFAVSHPRTRTRHLVRLPSARGWLPSQPLDKSQQSTLDIVNWHAVARMASCRRPALSLCANQQSPRHGTCGMLLDVDVCRCQRPAHSTAHATRVCH